MTAAFVDGVPALVLSDGALLIGDPDEQKRVAAHPDASILIATSDGKTLLTGGDDGRVVAVRADGSFEGVADEKGKWIDAFALRGEAYAWSVGKQVRARDEGGTVKTWSAPTTARGLAFQPKGFRLAATHYNGVTLWFPKVEGTPQTLEWKGAHRRDLLARWPFLRLLNAGERAARLEASGFAQHANDRISGEDAFALLVA